MIKVLSFEAPLRQAPGSHTPPTFSSLKVSRIHTWKIHQIEKILMNWKTEQESRITLKMFALIKSAAKIAS